MSTPMTEPSFEEQLLPEAFVERYIADLAWGNCTPLEATLVKRHLRLFAHHARDQIHEVCKQLVARHQDVACGSPWCVEHGCFYSHRLDDQQRCCIAARALSSQQKADTQ